MSTIHLTDKKGQKWTFDESEAVYRRSNYGLAVYEHQVLLIFDPRSDKWELPGGGVDEGETDEQGLVREIKEETGLDADTSKMQLIKQFHGFYKSLEKAFPWKTDRNYYHVRIKNPTGPLLKEGNGDDVTQCQWVDIDNLDSLDIDKVDLEVIKKGLNL